MLATGQFGHCRHRQAEGARRHQPALPLPARRAGGHREVLTKAHPDVPVYTASIDRQLNEKGYIVPGLGDAGDRMYGTK
jgi:hypothetical protein